MHSCYLIANRNCTYNGYTNNLQKRIRQHNGEIKGGARATTRIGPGWQIIAVITSSSPNWNKIRALSLEWHIRYPDNKRPRPKCFSGALGRIQGLFMAIKNPKFEEFQWIVYINPQYQELFSNYQKENDNLEAIHPIYEHPDLVPSSKSACSLVGCREYPPENYSESIESPETRKDSSRTDCREQISGTQSPSNDHFPRTEERTI